MLLLLLAQAPQCCSTGAMEDLLLPLIWSLTFSWGVREGFLGTGIVRV